MALNLIYKTLANGAITFTGNTQGLSKLEDASTKGSYGSIGAFTSLNSSNVASDFGAGTTFDYTQNGSYAYLDIPDDSTILFAHLTWAGIYSYNSLDVFVKDLSVEKDYPIIFTLSNDDQVSVTFEEQNEETNYAYDDSGELLLVTVKKYTNATDVTDYIKKSGSGKYSVESIPAILEAEDVLTSSTVHAGWSLAVVYENKSLPERTMCLWAGLSCIDPDDTTTVDIYLDGFDTSKTSDINARLLVSASEGDNDLTGDTLLFGEDENSLSLVSGPNNPKNNFFCSQINNDLGELDTRGSFGDVNHDALTGVNVVGARQGIDITNVDISSLVTNGQNSAMIRISSEGDVYSVNTIGLQIDTPQLPTDFLKTADKSYVNIGDTIEYTATITNTDTEDLSDIIFTDLDPTDTAFVLNSVSINGVSVLDVNPNDGFSLGALNSGETVTVSFFVTVESDIEDSFVNIATIEKSNSEGFSTTQNSNEVLVTLIQSTAILVATETVDKDEASLLDDLTYTVFIENTNKSTTTNNVFYTTLDKSTTFVDGSVTIDGVSYEKYDVITGFALSDITENTTVTFKVTVNSDISESVELVENYSYVEYTDISDVSQIKTVTSNTVQTNIVFGNLDITKSADSYEKIVGSVVEFSFSLDNTGKKSVYNVILYDDLDSSLSFVENSILVNGVSSSDDLSGGISIDKIDVSSTATVSFKAYVLENVDSIKNTAYAKYDFDISSSTITKTVNSNEVEIMILSAEIEDFVKSVDQTQAVLGDILTFLAKFENTGDVTASSIVLTDKTTDGMEFVENSLIVNGKEYTGYDITKGASLADVLSGETVEISFKMEVVSNDVDVITDALYLEYSYLSAGEVISAFANSNDVEVEILKPEIEVFKYADKQIAVLGDVIEYSFKVSNTGSTDLTEVDLTDLLDQNLAFVEGSVVIDGVSDVTQNPTSQILIGDLAVNTSIIVSFDATVVNNIGEQIENQSTVTANYTTKDGIIKTVGAFSNIAVVELRFPMLEITKTADVTAVSLGDTIHYSVVLENTGDTNLFEVLFKDYLPSSVDFVEGSFTLNGEVVNSVDLEQGVLIILIESGAFAYIEYDVTVTSGSCNKKITNSAQAFYNFQYSSEPTQTGQTDVASVTVLAEISNFKQISLNSKVSIPKVKPDMKTLDNTVASIDITDYYVVDVICGMSNEGQRLHGQKLIVHGQVNASVEYTEPCDSVHSAHWTIPFTTYIVLPKDYTKNRKIVVNAVVENVSSQALTCRDLDINTLALIIATIK